MILCKYMGNVEGNQTCGRKVENMVYFSTNKNVAKQVFHKVMHILHRMCVEILWKKEGKCEFMCASKKA